MYGQKFAILGQDMTFWHKHFQNHTLSGTLLVVKTPTLSGTLLENPTLSGTEMCQKGTLAVLAYAYCI